MSISPNKLCKLAVIPAAGKGDRMGGRTRKQYLMFSGKTVLEHTIERLLESGMQTIVVAVSPDDDRYSELAVANHEQLVFVEGGETRASSVLSGLANLLDTCSSDDWVLVHDAVRPCVSVADVTKLKESLMEHEVGGLLAARITDTIKQEADDKALHVENTVDRSGLWRALTPQMFRLGMLASALKESIEKGIPVTDEASAIEAMGYSPQLVEGSVDNIKITYPGDLNLAEYYLSRQEAGS
jgi:2-C-methyl-D-erythritol 4-phosphate cytidylyltransferase